MLILITFSIVTTAEPVGPESRRKYMCFFNSLYYFCRKFNYYL